MIDFKSVWSAAKGYLEEGVNLIAVRDKEEIGLGGRVYQPKSPFRRWEKYQKEFIAEKELYEQLEYHKTNNIATVCGKISGNLEAIDIDEHNKPGIAQLIFKEIGDLQPEIGKKLRINQTKKGGFHLIYRIEDHEVPGSKKIAGRLATEDELTLSKEKVKYFVETRGEGGYVVAPPSAGYTVRKENEIPLLTWSERMALINICLHFNEILPVEKVYKPAATENNIYEENPFDDFNRRCDPIALMEDLGYQHLRTTPRFIQFTRPGGTKGNIHTTFNLARRFFFNFSANSELETKGYKPSNLVGRIKFNDDKKQLYKYLVDSGYGVVRLEIEKKAVKAAAIKGGKVQGNFSEASKKELEALKADMAKAHPYGIFWEADDEDKIIISRERFYDVAEKMGFRFYKENLYQVVGKLIHKRTEREFFDLMKAYVKENDLVLYEDICNSYEAFIQRNGKFTIGRLKLLLEEEIIIDTRDRCNKFFADSFLDITADAITSHPYDDLQGLIFADRVQQRSYAHFEESIYIDFLEKSVGLSDHLFNTLGYLAHEYKDATTAYIVVLTETCPDPQQGGGSGKNVFCELLRNTTSYVGKPGTGAKFDEKFFQSWNGQRLFAISDVDEGFDFSKLKEAASGSILVKKLYANEEIEDVKNSPKLIVLTNYSYIISDGGLKRRIVPIEFKPFFTEAGGVDAHYGKLFPDDWAANDWNGYDTFIAECVQSWLKTGRKLKHVELSASGWEKQFKHTYKKVVYEIISQYWPAWREAGFVTNDDFKKNIHDYYNENETPPTYKPSSTKINAALSEWARHFGYFYEKDGQSREGGINRHGKKFTQI